jgi:hypothetical protein
LILETLTALASWAATVGVCCGFNFAYYSRSAGIRTYDPERAARDREEPAAPGSSTFKFAVNSRMQSFVGARPGPHSIGADASGSFRVAPEWCWSPKSAAASSWARVTRDADRCSAPST